MTPLGKILARRIDRDGPITVAEYMALCLGHSQHGYYRGGDPLGAAGDFTTAPEISQMFGELIGLWCIDVWRRMGQPDPVLLVEMGPGRGSLMADALRAGGGEPDWMAALHLHLVESSPALRRSQQKALNAWSPAWHDELASVPQGAMILLANEFFDTLPVRQLVRRDCGWCERLVALDATGQLVCVAASAESILAAALPAEIRGQPIGSVVELPVAGPPLVADIASRLTAGGGIALLIDYGHEYDQQHEGSNGRPSGDGATLSAIRHHAHEPILAHPGKADLSAHVDFVALAQTARDNGATVWGPTPQGRFLSRLGIGVRALNLMQADPATADATHQAVERLTSEEQMGALFKAMAIAAPGLLPPPGFDA